MLNRSEYVLPMPDQPAHMTPDEFRRQGHAAIDWIADYWASLDDLPVRAQVAPGDVRRLLPASAPEDAEPFDAVLADLSRTQGRLGRARARADRLVAQRDALRARLADVHPGPGSAVLTRLRRVAHL